MAPNGAPEFAQRIAAICASEGVTAMDPGVVELLCGAAHAHATQTLEAGIRAAFHANRFVPNAGDLAVGAEALKRRTPAPVSIVNVAEAARMRNNTPLPPLKCGVRLPPDSALAQPPSVIKDTTSANALDRLNHGSAPWNSPTLPQEYIEMLKREKEKKDVEKRRIAEQAEKHKEAKKADKEKPKIESTPENLAIVKTEMELISDTTAFNASTDRASAPRPVTKQEQ